MIKWYGSKGIDASHAVSLVQTSNAGNVSCLKDTIMSVYAS
jgi:hypothetical protein